MTRLKTYIAAALLGAPLAAHAAAPLVMRAGEWVSTVTMGAGRAPISPPPMCAPADRVLDAKNFTSTMGRAAQHCSKIDLDPTGSGTFSLACDIGGGHLLMTGTMEMDGPDSFITHTHSHMVGGTMKFPDMDMVTTAHRTGPCHPGDRQEPHH